MGYLKDYLVGLGLDAGKDFVVAKKTEVDIKQKLQDYIERQSKFNRLSTMAEEIDFQGWAEYLEDDFVEDVKKRLFGNLRERTVARKEIVNKAIVKAKAEDKEAKKRVAKLMNDAVDILRNYYKSELSHGSLMLAARVEDTITEKIQSSADEIKDVVREEIQRNIPFSTDHYLQMIQTGDFKGVEQNLKRLLNVLSNEHPLSPDYEFVYNGTQFLSKPKTEEAQKKHPPRFLCKAEIKVGEHYVDEISPEITEYANRHQFKITIDIQEAEKLLGDIPDPIQTEAEKIIGAKAVIEPVPFPPAFPCAIKLDGQTEYEYVELRTEEILDDGVIVISNREQQNTHMRIRMNVNFETKTVSFKMRTENATNRELFQYVRFMKRAMDGAKLTIYVLSLGKEMVQGDLSNCDYEGGFESIEEELAFLEGIVAMEDYFHTNIEVPEEIYDNDLALIKYVGSLLKGEECTSEWTGLNFGLTVNEQLRQKKEMFDNKPSNIAFVGEANVHLYGEVYPLQVIRRYQCAKLKDADTTTKMIDLLEDGDHIDIKYIPATEDGKSQFIDVLKTDDVVETE